MTQVLKSYSGNALCYYGEGAKFETITGSFDSPAADLLAGNVVAKVTTSGLYKAYDSSASDGTQTPIGILADDILAGAEAGTAVHTIYTAGVFHSGALTGWDSTVAAALTDIKAR